jgi:hypothetical protein
MWAMRGFQAFQDRAAVWLTLAALAVAGQFADILTTLAVLAGGGSEHNQVGAFLMRTGGGWPVLIGSKLLLALALGWTLCAFAASPSARRSLAGSVALVAGGLFAVGWWLVIGWNGAIWLIMAHALPWTR